MGLTTGARGAPSGRLRTGLPDRCLQLQSHRLHGSQFAASGPLQQGDHRQVVSSWLGAEATTRLGQLSQ